MASAAENLCPTYKYFSSKVNLFGVIVARRVEELAQDIEINDSFPSEMDSEYADVVYYTEVRWLSRGKGFWTEWKIINFMENKRNHQFNGPKRMADFGYLKDISMHLKDLTIRLQRKNVMIHNFLINFRRLR